MLCRNDIKMSAIEEACRFSLYLFLICLISFKHVNLVKLNLPSNKENNINGEISFQIHTFSLALFYCPQFHSSLLVSSVIQPHFLMSVGHQRWWTCWYHMMLVCRCVFMCAYSVFEIEFYVRTCTWLVVILSLAVTECVTSTIPGFVAGWHHWNV